MTTSTADKRRAFQALHRSGCFVMPNPWDVGSAVALESLGFPALATTSAGMAWSMGKPDNKVSLEDVLDHLTALAQRVAIPLNADFENAFADGPEDVATNVARAVDTGIAGLSVEDGTGVAATPLAVMPVPLLHVVLLPLAFFTDQPVGGVVPAAPLESKFSV